MSGYYPARAALSKADRLFAAALDRVDEHVKEYVEADLSTQKAPLVSPGAQDGAEELRALGLILPAAQRVEDATGRLQSFVDDFYGPTSVGEEPATADPGVGYNSHIKRLIAALDNLDVVIGKVREIG